MGNENQELSSGHPSGHCCPRVPGAQGRGPEASVTHLGEMIGVEVVGPC